MTKKTDIAIIDSTVLLDCPNCPNQGWYPWEDMKGNVTQVQCQWCAIVPNSVFNGKSNAPHDPLGG